MATSPKTLPKSAKTVTVASKLPMSIEIQLCQETTAAVTGQFGSVKEKVHVKTGPIYVIRGNGYPVGQTPKGFPKAPSMLDETGYALTPGVDADWWAKWLEQNANTDMVRNGLIKAHSSDDHLAGITKEDAAALSGLEPLNPEGDARNPKPLNTMVGAIKTEPRTAA